MRQWVGVSKVGRFSKGKGKGKVAWSLSVVDSKVRRPCGTVKWAGRDSNSQRAELKPAASADWATGPMTGEGVEPSLLGFESSASASWATPPSTTGGTRTPSHGA